MTFTRTTSGIRNYPNFYNVDIVVYTEGSTTKTTEDSEFIPDRFFYKTLLSNIFDHKKIEIKCVGNKQTALAYVQPIINSGLKNSIVIVDRDYDNLRCSLLEIDSLMYTNGYSWENDLWTLELVSSVLKDLTLQSDEAVTLLQKNYLNALKRLKILSILDAAAQINSKCILPKNSGACGINVNYSNTSLIAYSELKRLIIKFKSICDESCRIVQSVLKKARKLEPSKIIQGHLWAHVITKLISHIYTLITKNTKLPTSLIRTLILNKFLSDPSKYLGLDTYNYYSKQLALKIGPLELS